VIRGGHNPLWAAEPERGKKKKKKKPSIGDMFISMTAIISNYVTPVPTKLSTATLRSNHAIHCYLCYWYVLVSKISSEI
jgi:hypothetical protein